MRNLVILVLVAAGLWSGWWFIGASAKEQAIEGWLERQRAQGWVAEHGRLSVAGFPSRFDTTLTDLAVADPRSGWAWHAPTFQILALAYAPNHVIAVWPGEQRVSNGWETITTTSEQMRGSVVFEPDTQLALDRTAIEIDAMELSGSTGWTASLERGFLATRQAEAGTAPDFAHDISFTAQGLILPAPVKATLDPAGLLPERLTNAELTVTPAFTGPWNRRAVETGAFPELTAVNLRNLVFSWGDLDLRAKGRLSVDRRGFADGTIDITARNWRHILDLAVQGGVLPADLRDPAERGLALIEALGGTRGTLQVPLTFSDGLARLGPIPIGRAPLLR